MSDIAIKFENISKQYRLGLVGTGTISHDLNRWWHTVRGKEDPYLMVGEVNDRSVKGESKYVWALKDITFDIKQGEVIGIIGRNGAGKSTLLKILSRVTSPTTGIIKARGRIASLLEVGTGFHPELTGRENIYMNGSIMGMTKAEITSKLDEIVDFAGIERYIDTPAKRYSSGMTVRLGFAIAAHLEPEILVVDEVLAVGDAEFQKKAIGKMQDVSRGEGRTVLFVSHNMASIKKLCTRGVLLNNGTVDSIGDIDYIIQQYELQSITDSVIDIANYKRRDNLGQDVYFTDVKMYNELNEECSALYFGEKFYMDLDYSLKGLDLKDLNIGIRFETANDIYITSCLSSDNETFFSIDESSKDSRVRVRFSNFMLNPGDYFVTISIRKGKIFYDQVVKAKKITVHPYDRSNLIEYNNAWGLVKTDSVWEKIF